MAAGHGSRAQPGRGDHRQAAPRSNRQHPAVLRGRVHPLRQSRPGARRRILPLPLREGVGGRGCCKSRTKCSQTKMTQPADTPPHVGAILEIDLPAIVANWRTLCTRHPNGAVAGVVKADAYGLGAQHVAPALHAAGCRHFFVALLDEALPIRPLLPGAMLGVLNGLLPGTEPDYISHDLTP